MAERQPDRITVNLGFTHNIGNFNSVRADVGLESDRLEGESISEHFSRVYNFVETKFLEEFEDTEAEVQKKIKKKGIN